MNLEPWHIWIIVGIFLLVIEMLVNTFHFASFGVAALLTGIGAACGASTAWQLGLFAILSSFNIGLIRPLLAKNLYKHSEDRPTNVHAMHGQVGVVVEDIPDAHSPGRVKIWGEEWRAIAPSGRIASGAKVVIQNVDGATLTVAPAGE